MMKIAMLTSSYPRYEGDGTAPFIRAIAENYVLLGHEVYVVAPYDVAIKPMPEHGVRVHRFKYIWPRRFHIMGHARALEADVKFNPLSYFLLPFFLLSGIFKLREIVTKYQIDVIHINWVIPNGPIGYLVSRFYGIPNMVSLHGSDMYAATRNRLYQWIARIVFRSARKITACSPELRDAAIQVGADPSKIVLVPYGVDPLVFAPEKKTTVLDHDASSKKETVVVSIGRLVYKKGFDKLISAWRIVEQYCTEARLVIGGEGPLRRELQQQIDALGLKSVELPGRIPWNEVPAFLANSDIFVLPSIRDAHGNMDGLPNVLLEAMSSQTAVIASNLGGVGLVIEDGVNGIIVPQGDIERLAQAMLQLANNPELRSEMARHARQSIVDKNTWKQTTMRFAELLQTTESV